MKVLTYFIKALSDKRKLIKGLIQQISEAATGGVLERKAVLKNFAIFTEKHLYWSLFVIKLQVLRPATLLKRDSNTGIFV